MAANSMLTHLKEEPSVSRAKTTGSNLNNLKIDKEGWIKKRSRHLKKWRNRFAQIEDDQYLCTYHDESMNNCTEKIDITQATIHYVIDQPKEFQIHIDINNTEFYFECDSILDANDWLRNLKQINVTSSKIPTSPKKSAKKKKNIDINDAHMNDINLIPTTPISPKSSCDDNKDNTKLSETDINEIYMRAVSLYQHKHYEECERITKDVLRADPAHIHAAQLCDYLISKKYQTDNGNKKKNLKGIRQRFKTVAVTKSGDNDNNNKPKPKPKPKQEKKRGFTLFGRKNDKKDEEKQDAKIAADLTLQETEEDQKTPKATEKQKINPCQLEFQRFITERIQLNKYYEDLGERFEIAKYDDIRFLKDFDAEILGDEIGLRPLHIKCFLRKIEIFLDEIKLFQQWLEQIVLKQKSKDKFNNITSNGLIDLFENNGITTFEALYRYIESKNDLEKIVIGHHDETKFNKMVYDILWNEMRKIEKKQTMRMSVVAQSYGQINADILGINDHDYNNGNFISNPTDDPFEFASIAEHQSMDDELNQTEGAQPETAYIVH